MFNAGRFLWGGFVVAGLGLQKAGKGVAENNILSLGEKEPNGDSAVVTEEWKVAESSISFDCD